MTRTLTLFAAFVFAGVASDASAANKIWWVPGVINNGAATVISCTNGGAAAVTVAVDVFNRTGGASGSGSYSIPTGGTGNFATQGVASVGVDSNLGSGLVLSGSARITAPAGVFCTAYVVDPVNDPPSVGWQLNIVAKTTQKGD